MFITFEGIEGSGKTTQIKYVLDFLKGQGHPCVHTREPGGTLTGKKIRAILLDPETKGLSPWTELLLYIADRIQHVTDIIQPNLAAGKTVLCDRFFDATIAYQGFARGLDKKSIYRLHRLFLNDLKPDLTILLDLPPDVGLSRAWHQIESGERVTTESRFEEKAISFHARVRNGYLTLAHREPNRFRIVDALQKKQIVRKAILQEIASFLSLDLKITGKNSDD